MSRNFGAILVASLISIFATVTLSQAAGVARGPSGCPPSLDANEWVCLTKQEAQQARLRELDANDKLIDLREENARLRLRVPSGIRRYVNPWATIGAEYLPNDRTYRPYGLTGVDVGHVSVWGGFFDDAPVAGVGWRF